MPRAGQKCTRCAEERSLGAVCLVNVSDRFLQEAVLDRNTEGGPWLMVDIGWQGKDRAIVEKKEKTAKGHINKAQKERWGKKDRREGVIKLCIWGSSVHFLPRKPHCSYRFLTASWAQLGQEKRLATICLNSWACYPEAWAAVHS